MMTRFLGVANHSPGCSNAWWDIRAKAALSAALHFINTLGFVGFVESFEADARRLCELLQIPYRVKRVNQSAAVTELDEETLRLVKEVNKLDQMVYQAAHTRAQQLSAIA
jgi:hypothetical protein